MPKLHILIYTQILVTKSRHKTIWRSKKAETILDGQKQEKFMPFNPFVLCIQFAYYYWVHTRHKKNVSCNYIILQHHHLPRKIPFNPFVKQNRRLKFPFFTLQNNVFPPTNNLSTFNINYAKLNQGKEKYKWKPCDLN